MNLYWPVYKNLEHQFTSLMFDIHMDDNQLSVYSLKIADLVLRAVVEIESISKDLYQISGGTKITHIKYDDDAIKFLNDIWKLDKKVVIISATNCFISNRSLYPFVKNEAKTSNGKMSFGWNNAYQNIKHDRANSLKFGSVSYLFQAMAALYVLNLYFKDEVIELARDSQATSFPINMGSEIFSISLHKWFMYDNTSDYHKKPFFDECIYLTKETDESRLKVTEAHKERHQTMIKLFQEHPKFMKFVEDGELARYTGDNLMWDVLGQQDYANLHNRTFIDMKDVYKTSTYEGVLNKHII